MLIKSVSVSFSILNAFIGRRTALTLKEIGYQAGLPPSKAHRYLQSLIREGMVAQDPRTRLYRLGTTAIALGLEALENTDPVVNACEIVRPLAAELDVGIGVDVLGDNGPICIWCEQPVTPLPVPARLGCSQSLLSSAAGQVFLSFLPRHATRALAAREMAEGAAPLANPDDVAFEVRSRGYAHLPARPGAAAMAIAAPVLDARGEACAAVTFFARGNKAEGEEGLVAALSEAAREASAYRLPEPRPHFAPAGEGTRI
jgi:DNA-binding IclR family transcriptional regulator